MGTVMIELLALVGVAAVLVTGLIKIIDYFNSN